MNQLKHEQLTATPALNPQNNNSAPPRLRVRHKADSLQFFFVSCQDAEGYYRKCTAERNVIGSVGMSAVRYIYAGVSSQQSKII